MAIGGVALI